MLPLSVLRFLARFVLLFGPWRAAASATADENFALNPQGREGRGGACDELVIHSLEAPTPPSHRTSSLECVFSVCFLNSLIASRKK